MARGLCGRFWRRASSAVYMLTPRWELRGVGRVRAVISQVADDLVDLS